MLWVRDGRRGAVLAGQVDRGPASDRRVKGPDFKEGQAEKEGQSRAAKLEAISRVLMDVTDDDCVAEVSRRVLGAIERGS